MAAARLDNLRYRRASMSLDFDAKATLLAAVAVGVFLVGASPLVAQTPPGRYEVWIVDQSDTGEKRGARFMPSRGRPRCREPVECQAGSGGRSRRPVSAMCLARTGANPIRPHRLLFNRGNTHALLAFVASGRVVILQRGNA
jgi:hypothetical protein